MASAAVVKRWNPMMCSETEVVTARSMESEDAEDRLEQFFRLQERRWEESFARLQRLEASLRPAGGPWRAPCTSPRSLREASRTLRGPLPGDEQDESLDLPQNMGDELEQMRVRSVASSSSPLALEPGKDAIGKDDAKILASLADGSLPAEGARGLVFVEERVTTTSDGPIPSTSEVALLKLQNSSTAKKIQEQTTKREQMASDLAMAKNWQKTESSTPQKSSQDDLPWYWQESARVMGVVRNPLFDVFIASVILTNTVIIGVEVDREVRGLSPEPGTEYMAIVFTFLFGLELVMRIIGERLMFLAHPQDFGWNWFDLFIVGFSFIDLVLQSAFEGAADMSFLRLLRVVRCVRVIRIFRLSRFFRELRLMIFLIFCSFRSLMWVFVLLSMVIYIFAVIFTKGAAEEMYHDDHDNESDEDLVLYYGTLFDSMLTLLKAAFGGADWGDLLEPLWHCSLIYVFTFIAFEAFMLLAVLNIVTGVFVQNTMDSAKKDLDLVIQDEMESKDSVLAELRELFMEVESKQSGDERGTGFIGEEAFDQLLGQERMQAYFQAVGIEVSEAKGLFRLLDTDSSGRVNAEEFAMGCLRLRGEAKKVDVVTLMYENKRMIQTITNVINEMHMEYHAIMAEVYAAEKASQASLKEVKKADQPCSNMLANYLYPQGLLHD